MVINKKAEQKAFSLLPLKFRLVQLFLIEISLIKHRITYLGLTLIKSISFHWTEFKSQLKIQVLKLILVLKLIKTYILGNLKCTVPLLLLLLLSLSRLSGFLMVSNHVHAPYIYPIETYTSINTHNEGFVMKRFHLPLMTASVSSSGLRLLVREEQRTSRPSVVVSNFGSS